MEIKISAKIGSKEMKEIQEEISMFYAVHLTMKQLKSFILKDKELAFAITIYGFDTECRERLMDVISNDLCSSFWPLFANGDEIYKKWKKKFKAGAKAKGIKLDAERWE